MTDDEIQKQISSLEKYSTINVAEIMLAVGDARIAVKTYNISDESLNRAVRLYACHLLFMRVIKYKQRFQTVKAENASYVKFDTAADDDAWSEFQELLAEQGYGETRIQFL